MTGPRGVRPDYAHLRRLRRELEATMPIGFARSGDPAMIGEHEVAPLRCKCCGEPIPWALIKGLRS